MPIPEDPRKKVVVKSVPSSVICNRTHALQPFGDEPPVGSALYLFEPGKRRVNGSERPCGGNSGWDRHT
jgi:hypothetical protein